MELERARDLLAELDSGWELNAAGHLERQFGFGNFVEAMDFANRVTEIAEAENHHPDLHIAWARCVVEIWTPQDPGSYRERFRLCRQDRPRVQGRLRRAIARS